MKHLTDTIREALEFFECGSYSTSKALTALTALSELERMAGEQEPVAWINPKTGTVISEKEKTMWHSRCGGMNSQGTNDDNMKAYAAAHTEPCFAAPPAQQPQEEHLTITWDEQQTRILAVTMQDEEGRILKVLAEAPARQPHERHLLNLLARIHGDGGHYTAEHGLEKSVSDADQKVADLHLKAWEAQQPQRITPAELAKRIERGEKWQLDEQPVGRVDGDGHVTWFAPIPEGGANLYAAQQPQAEAVPQTKQALADALYALQVPHVACQDGLVTRCMCRKCVIKRGDEALASPQQAEAMPLDMGVMELAESVGLIGPASRTDDFHAAIQRFHDLISMNVSIKAAVHFAQGLPKKGGAA